ncbi:MAG: glycosyltransferase family A protein [bacterium]|nr:glycosyltransferase family A protein [bacterium]
MVENNNQKLPLVSVVIPAWNSETTIRGTLDSLFNQTNADFEVIVVDDGSTDKTAELVRTYGKGVRLISQENQGSNPARNRGWREAQGRYLFFLDSDVALRADCFEKLLAALDAHPEASYAYASFRFGKKLFRLWPFDPERLRRMPFIHTGAMIRAEDFPGFDESIKRLQDWDVFLTMLERGKSGVWVSEVLFSVALREQGISAWVPRWLYWIPWRFLGWKPKRVEKYEQAVRVIQQKHGLVLKKEKPFR